MHVKMAKDNEVWMGDTESPLNAHAFISMEVDRTDPPSSEHCTLILRSESVLTWFSNDSSSCTTDSDDLSIELEQDASDEIIPIWDGVIRTSPFSSLMANNCPFENQQNLNYLNKHYKPSSRDVVSHGNVKQRMAAYRCSSFYRYVIMALGSVVDLCKRI